MEGKSKNESMMGDEDFDDCLCLINQSLFSEKSYLEWLGGAKDQSRSTAHTRRMETSGSSLQQSFSNQSEEHLSICSYDSRQETSFHDEGFNELLYCDPQSGIDMLSSFSDQGSLRAKPTSYCLCSLDTSRSISRNIKISNCFWDGKQLLKYFSNFGEIHLFDQCKLYTERSVRIAYFDLRASYSLIDSLKSSDLLALNMEFECLNDLSDFSTIDYFLVGKTTEYSQGQLVDFCSFFGEVRECVSNASVFIIKFSDVRSLKKIEKILESFRDNEKNQLKFLRGIFYHISEKSLRSMLCSMMVFSKDNSSEIFFSQINSEKLCSKDAYGPGQVGLGKLPDEEMSSKFKKRTLRISAESFLFNQQPSVRSPLADLTNKEAERAEFNDFSMFKGSIPPGLRCKEYMGKDCNFSINLEKVVSREDSRTTIMIRNIPNRFNQEALLRIIDQNFKGLYDFFYLPMDFKNKCNIGYAFINFTETRCIVDFFSEFNDKRWDILRSEKICKVCYARIQGRNALIKHFKRSNIINLELVRNFSGLSPLKLLKIGKTVQTPYTT